MPETSFRIINCVCPHDCPDTCGIKATVSGDRLIKVEGNPENPYTRGNLCRKVAHYEERVYSPDRVLYPQRRVGPKGSGQFERISWEDALTEITDRWKSIISEFGPEAILPYSYAGTMGVVNMFACEGRLWNRMGACRLDRTICSTAGQVGHTYTMGWNGGMDSESFAHSKFIIAWGTNLSSTNVHQMPFVREAQKAGATFVVIDPYRTRTANAADWFLQIKPGTDSALALGMMNIIFNEKLHDEPWLEAHSIGWRELRDRAAEYPLSEVADMTGLAAEDILKLARMYATEQPSAIRLGYGLTRNTNGGMMARTITCLPAVIGAWGKPGSGLLLSTSGHFSWNRAGVKRPDLHPENSHGELPRLVNMNELGIALADTEKSQIRSMMVWNSNPAAVAPNSNLVRAGMCREDLFTVVHEQMMTDTALLADIVLPATSQMEHLDLHNTYGHLYTQLNMPAIPPMGEARPNIDVHHELARRMGYKEACFSESAEEIIKLALDVPELKSAGITWDYLVEHGFAKVKSNGGVHIPYVDGQGFGTPSGKVELYSESAAKDGFDPLPNYTPLSESEIGSPELYRKYPINLASPAAHHFLNSTFSNLASLQKSEKEPRIWIHPNDAASRGVTDGDKLRVWNNRGEAFLVAVVSDKALPGTAWSPSLWWHKDSPQEANVNVLTSDVLTDMGGGATFHTNLVQFEVTLTS